MLTIAQFRATYALGSAGVDSGAGVIRGVKIITEGAAAGHAVLIDPKTGKREGEWREGLVAYPLMVDVETCGQIMAAAAGFGEQGLPIKFNPQTFDHGTGALVGAARNFRIEGASVVADAYLLASYEHRDYLIELAATMPSNFGLSIDFMIAQEQCGEVFLARCEKLLAVTVVDRPAANVGLFRVGEEKEFDANPEITQPATSTKSAMDPEAIAALVNSIIAPLMAKIDALTPAMADEASAEEFAACDDDAEKEKIKGMSAKQRATYFATRKPKTQAVTGFSAADLAKAAKDGATLALEEATARQTGRQPTAPANPGADGKATGFPSRVAAFRAAGAKSDALAIAQATQAHPGEYNDWVKAGRPAIKANLAA